MQRNTILIAVIIIAVVVIGAFAATFLIPKGQTQAVATTGEKTTKAAFYDQGTDWIHSVAVIQDIYINGTNKSDVYFVDMWMKPKDKEYNNLWDLPGKDVIDLSHLLGHGENPLPAGTTMRVKLLSDIVNNQSVGETHLLQESVHAWSNTPTPPQSAQVINITGMDKVYPLPANIKDNCCNMTSDATQGSIFLQQIKCISCELLLTVNADGSVTITVIQPPVFCHFMADSNYQ